MSIEEYNKLEVVQSNTNEWMHKGVGVIKKYHRNSKIISNDNYFIFGNVSKILPNIDEIDARLLKTLGWKIKEFNSKNYLCYKNNNYE